MTTARRVRRFARSFVSMLVIVCAVGQTAKEAK
jgi:hypothetical protein